MQVDAVQTVNFQLHFLRKMLITPILYHRGGQHINQSTGRSPSLSWSITPILQWIAKIPRKNIFQSIFQKVHKKWKCSVLWHFVLVTLLPTGQSWVIKKFSNQSQSKTSWPPLLYQNHLFIGSCSLKNQLPLI